MKKAEKKPAAGELRVLILEDNPADAELVERELRRAKIAFTSMTVEGKRAFSKALADFQPQVILSDFKLPRFDGLAALAIARLQAPDTPFLFVSGSIGEEMAIETLALGAADYIFKDNLARLGPAVNRVIEAARLRQEKKETDEKLSRHVEELRLLAEAADDFVQINDLDKLYEYLARTVRALAGVDYLSLSIYEEPLQALRPKIVFGLDPFRKIAVQRFGIDPMQMVFYLKDMRPQELSDFVSRRLTPGREGLHGLFNRQIPRSVARALEKLLAIGSTYTMGLSWENQLFGGLTLLFKQGHELKNASQIEALGNLAAVAIKRLQAEESLRASERMFSTLVANLPGFVYRCRNDRDWTMEYISEGCREITGHAPEEFIHNRKLAYNDIIHPDHKEILWQEWQADLAKHQPFEMEYRIIRATGETRWVWERGQGVYGPDGALLFIEGFITDITPRQQAKDQLRESEIKYRTLVTQSPDGIFIIDLQGNFLSTNQSMCDGLGYSEEEFLSMNLRDIVPDTYFALHKKRLAEIMDGKSQNDAAEYEVKAKDGTTRHIAILSAPYFRQSTLIGFQGIARDVTEKKKMEILLRESEEYYRTLVDTSPDAIIIVDAGGRVTFASQRTFETFGIPPQTVITGISIFDFVEPGEIPKVRDRMVEILSGRSHPGITVYRLMRHDRQPFWGEVSSSPLRDASGRSIALLLVCRDISQRKQAETALCESEEKYRLIAENTADTISVLDLDLKFTYVSPSISRLRGFTVEEALKQTMEDTLTRDSLARIREIFTEEMALEMSGTADPQRSRSMELQEIRKDGSIVWVENSVSFLRDPQGKPNGILAVSKDISERKRAEEQIRYQASLLQDVSDAIIATDQDNRIQVWNKAAEQIYGWKAEEAIGRMLHDVLEPEYRYQGREEVMGRLKNEGAWSGEIVHHHRDGRPITIQSSITNLKGPGGEPAGMVSINSDITERKRAEAEFLRERVFLEKLVETAPEGIVIADNQGRVLKVNSEFVRMFGYDFDEAAGKLIDDLVVPPQYREESHSLNKSVGEGKKAVLESVRSRRDGSLLHVSIIIAPIYIEGEQVAVYAIYQDISERKRAEAIQHIQYEIANAMVTAESFFSLFETVRKELGALFDTTNFLVALYDEASGMLSAPFEKDEKDAISQWPAEKSLTGLVIKQKRSMLLRGEEIQQLDKADSTEQIGSNAETWLGVPLLINEKVLGAIVVQSYDNPDAYDQSSVIIMEIIASQLSVYIKRKQTELELHESEAQYRAFFNTSRDCVYITSPAGRWLSMNDAAVELFGYSSREELSQVNISDLYANPEERAKHVRIVTELGYSKESPVDLRKKDGTVINALITEVSRYDTDGKVTGFQGTIRDISERKRDEEQIRASLKEKEVLLQEIHHRVKNNLQIISGLLTLQADQAAGKSLDEIFRESQDRIRTIALIHEKLYRSHNLAEIAFDDYLRNLVENLFNSYGVDAGRITAAYDMEKISFTIEKAIPLGLIVNELVTNALKHAFPAGRRGEIRIGLHGRPDAKTVTLKTDSGALHVVPTCELVVADNGVGLPAGFDTARQKTLGMNLVSMLTKQLQAEIQVKTTQGSEFRLIFPTAIDKSKAKDKPRPGGI